MPAMARISNAERTYCGRMKIPRRLVPSAHRSAGGSRRYGDRWLDPSPAMCPNQPPTMRPAPDSSLTGNRGVSASSFRSEATLALECTDDRIHHRADAGGLVDVAVNHQPDLEGLLAIRPEAGEPGIA